MPIGGQVDVHWLNRHGPLVHAVTAAPPEAQRPLRPLRGLDLVNSRAGAVRLLIGHLPHIAHAGEEHHQPGGVVADVGIVRPVDGKGLLLAEHPRRVAGRRLAKAENKVGGGHKVQREHVKLDTDPQHQRHAEDTAQHRTRPLPGQQQRRCGQVGQAVEVLLVV